MTRLLAGFFDLVVSRDPALRLRMTRVLIAVGIYLPCVALEWFAYTLGIGELQSVRVLSFFCIVGPLGFAIAVRSGFAERYAEPSLTMPQVVYAITMLAIAYHVHPHCRGTMPMILALVLVYGAFVLSPRTCALLGGFALAMFATTMLYGAVTQPAVFDPQVEAFAFAFLVLTVVPLCLLCGELSRLRLRSQRQKQELRTMMEQLRKHASQDDLTGLPNRRHVQQWIPREIARLARSGGTLCLALLDLDRFKRVNDTFGHAAGDEVLRIFARETGAVLRASDMLARWGGEEFLLVMPDTRMPEALALIERARARVALPAGWAAFPQTRVTFSAGLTVLQPGQTLEHAVQWADFALYEAKAQGRDRTIVAEGGEAPLVETVRSVLSTNILTTI